MMEYYLKFSLPLQETTSSRRGCWLHLRTLTTLGMLCSMDNYWRVHSFSQSFINSYSVKKDISVPVNNVLFSRQQQRGRFGSNRQDTQFQSLRQRRHPFNLPVAFSDDETSVDLQQQEPIKYKKDETNNEIAFDRLLSDSNVSSSSAEINLAEAVSFLKNHPDLPLTKARWFQIFQAIEQRTASADEAEIGMNTRQQRDASINSQQPTPASQARKEMTDMYQTLHQLGHLQLFGAVSTIPPPLNPDPSNAAVLPAMGSDQVSPSILETITGVSMTTLTPKPTNSVLLAGSVLAVIELIASITTGVSFNFLAFVTLMVAFMDRLLLNGAVLESFVKILSPQLQAKIVRHEAGHFLCAYLLGCPVEGCVLSAWAALQDARFGLRRNSVSAGTSFYDPILSQQIHSHISDTSNIQNTNNLNALLAPTPTGKVTKSSVQRYSIIVMAGIAAEAIQYGQADGGASDEFALVSFLTQLNRRGTPVWNDLNIRNQARWGAMQAILMLRQYKPCYDALVDVLERGGSLGECIYAIEKSARDANLTPLTRPLGYIVDRGGDRQEWSEVLPENGSATAVSYTDVPTTTAVQQQQRASVISEKDSMAELEEIRKLVKQRLEEIDTKLADMS